MELWFTEQEHEQNIRVSWRAKDVLFQGRSPFQTVEVIETAAYGRMLILDGCVMLTESDEFVYHEMIAHVPAVLHPHPREVVVIGGGDGGTVRELLKHPGIERIVLCEIDGMVVDACKRFFPQVAGGLTDPRCEVRIGDGVAYMRELKGAIDLAIIDSTDPIGPGEGLFSRDFYRSVAEAMRPGGMMVAQSESPWFDKEVLGRIHRNIAGGFAHQRSYVGAIPTYPRGLWSWTMASNTPFDPARYDRQRLAALAPQLKYLTTARVPGLFELPPFYAEKIRV